jgi:hypothetical protein
MRKLAREAVIFMLLTPLFLAVGIFIYFHSTIPNKVVLDTSTFRPLTEAEKAVAPPGATGIAKAFPPSPACLNFRSDGDCSNRAFLLAALFFGLYGVPAGLGLWVLYRVIRFAITG